MNTHLFSHPKTVWFPDLAQKLTETESRCARNPERFGGLCALPAYLGGGCSAGVFAAQFLETVPSQKMLSKDRALYQRITELCTSLQAQEIDLSHFDEQLLLAYRQKPAEEVFAPAYGDWTELTALYNHLEEKQKRMPLPFDGTSWTAYLSGNVTRTQFAETFLSWDVSALLAQHLAHGVDKEKLAQDYVNEIEIVRALTALCKAFLEKQISPAEFDEAFLELAKKY